MGAHGKQLGFSTQVDEGCELERNFTFGGSTQQVPRLRSKVIGPLSLLGSLTFFGSYCVMACPGVKVYGTTLTLL